MNNILTLLFASILFILTHSQVSNIFVKTNRLLNLKNKNDKIGTIRKLGEENSDDVDDDKEDNTYYPETNEEEETNQTGILDPKSDNYNADINVVKVCNYKYNRSDKKITFNIIFSFIKTKVVRYIKFFLSIEEILNLRILEEAAETYCTIVDGNEVGSQNINAKYNCVSYTKYDSFTIKGGSDFQKSKDNSTFEDIENGEINFSQNAVKEFKDIKKQTEDINYSVTLNDGTLKDVSKKRFTIKGRIDDNYENIKDDKNVTLTLYPNGEDKEVEVDCEVIINKKTYYQIRCTPSEEFNAILHLASGITENKNQIVLNMTNDKNLSLEEAPSTMNRVYKKSSEGGLNGGGIAGIIIACVVALVIASIVAIMLRKPKPPVQSTSTVVQANSVENLNS